MSPDGTHSAVARGALVTLHDEEKGTRTTIDGLGGAATRVALSSRRGHALVALAGPDAIIESNGAKTVFRAETVGPVAHLAWSADGALKLAAGPSRAGDGGYLTVWREGETSAWTRSLERPATAVAISADGRVGVTL